jgi:hypothetical protein
VFPVVPPSRVIQVAGGMHPRHLHTATLVAVVTDRLGDRSAPNLIMNRKLDRRLVPHRDLVKPGPLEVREISR